MTNITIYPCTTFKQFAYQLIQPFLKGMEKGKTPIVKILGCYSFVFQKMKVILQEPKTYGEFYTGDSYILLHVGFMIIMVTFYYYYGGVLQPRIPIILLHGRYLIQIHRKDFFHFHYITSHYFIFLSLFKSILLVCYIKDCRFFSFTLRA